MIPRHTPRRALVPAKIHLPRAAAIQRARPAPGLPRRRNRFRLIAALLAGAVLAGPMAVVSGSIESASASASVCAKMATPVTVSVRPANDSMLATASPSEAAAAKVRYGYTERHGTPFAASTVPQAGLVGVYRLYNPANNTFLWTVWPSEVASGQAKYGLQNQGVFFYAAEHRTNACQVQINRLYRNGVFRAAVAGSPDELAWLKQGWSRNLEGTFFASATPGSQTLTVAAAPPPAGKPTPGTPTQPAPTTPKPAEPAGTGQKVVVSASFDSQAIGAVNPSQFLKALSGTGSTYAPNYSAISIVSNPNGPGRVVRNYLQAGTIRAIGNNGVALPIKLPGSYDSACVAYDVMFDARFDWSGGGKLPGLVGVAPGVDPTTPAGGHPTSLGWSGRIMWLGSKITGRKNMPNTAVSYMYHPGQSTRYGDDVTWNSGFVAGQWHHVQVCYTMNTVGKRDGVLKAWMDGVQRVNVTNFVYRTRGDVHIGYLEWDVFRGGGTIDWAGSHADDVYIDNMVVTAG